jgi:hypothetical protein
MPSVIGDIGYNGLGGPTANYLKAKPSTRFATRQLAFVEVQVTGVANNPYDSNSLYSSAVRGIQVVAEIYAVGEPASDKFMVVIAQDTDGANDLNDLANNNASMSQTMENAVRKSVGNGPTTVHAVYKHLHGAGFDNGVKTYSDESVGGNNYAD